MFLQGKTVVVFGATGAIGGAVVQALVSEGARVYGSGRDPVAVDRLAAEPGVAARVVDASDEVAVASFLDAVAFQAGGVDGVFNAIGLRAAEAEYATRSVDLPMDLFLLPLRVIAGSQFLTARSAARFMGPRGTGAIITLSASLSGLFVPYMAGITAACGAIEAMTRSLAAEWGPAGIRVNCVRAGAMPGTRTIQETSARMRALAGSRRADRPFDPTVLGRCPELREVADAVAYLASDRASAVAGQVFNVCAGALRS